MIYTVLVRDCDLSNAGAAAAPLVKLIRRRRADAEAAEYACIAVTVYGRRAIGSGRGGGKQLQGEERCGAERRGGAYAHFRGAEGAIPSRPFASVTRGASRWAGSGRAARDRLVTKTTTTTTEASSASVLTTQAQEGAGIFIWLMKICTARNTLGKSRKEEHTQMQFYTPPASEVFLENGRNFPTR